MRKGVSKYPQVVPEAVFGRWTVLRKDEEKSKGRSPSLSYWVCSCKCGTVRSVMAQTLSRGRSPSCGCYSIERAKTMNYIHGMSSNVLKGNHRAMIERCYNPNHEYYYRYGGRGITVCDEWRHSLKKFIEDMEPTYQKSLTLNRKNNDLGYSKENCEWSTRKEQAWNKSNTIMIDFQGEKRKLLEIAKEYSINPDLLRTRYYRRKRGLDLVAPVRPRKKKEKAS